MEMIDSQFVQAVSQTAPDGGFNLGTLLMFVGGAILLAFFCSIGVIARLREHRLEERKLAERASRSSGGPVAPAA